MNFKEAAARLGCHPARVPKACAALGIPKPLTDGDIARLGTYMYGPHSHSPKVERQADGHWVVLV